MLMFFKKLSYFRKTLKEAEGVRKGYKMTSIVHWSVSNPGQDLS